MDFITIKNTGSQSKTNFWAVLIKKKNAHDYCAIKTCQKADGKVVGHPPMEISGPTKYLLDRGAQITATLKSKSYYASHLVQEGLEIP